MAGSHLDYSSLATSMVKMVSFMDMVLLNMNMLTDKALPSCPPRPDRIQANDLRDEISYESIATVGEIRVWWRADFQSGSRVLKKVF